MADESAKLTFRLLGDNSGFNKAMDQANSKTNGLSGVMGKLGGVIAAAFAVGKVVDFVKEVGKVGMAFEAQMAKVQAISGASGEELALLTEEARRLGATTMFSATEAGQGLEYFAMAGWSVQDSITALEPTLRLAQAAGADLGITADILSDAITAFGMNAGDAAGFADLLAKTSSSANTNVEMLGESFKYVAPVIGALGGDAEDTAMALGLMANAGIKGSQAGTALRAGITNLIKPTKQMQEAMDEFGINAVFAADGSFDLKATMDLLRTTLGQLEPAQQANAAATIFGKEAMSGMLAIVNATNADYLKLTDATTNYTGTASEMAATMENTVDGAMKNLKSAFEELQLVLYEKLIPIFMQLIEWDKADHCVVYRTGQEHHRHHG